MIPDFIRICTFDNEQESAEFVKSILISKKSRILFILFDIVFFTIPLSLSQFSVLYQFLK